MTFIAETIYIKDDFDCTLEFTQSSYSSTLFLLNMICYLIVNTRECEAIYLVECECKRSRKGARTIGIQMSLNIQYELNLIISIAVCPYGIFPSS